MRYLCNSKGGGDSLYPSTDSKRRARIDALLDYNGTAFRPTITAQYIFGVLLPAIKKSGEKPEEE